MRQSRHDGSTVHPGGDGGLAVDHEEALDVLGLRGPVDAATVKRAYRRLARQLHPDAGGDANEFHRVRTAFEAIGGGTAATRGPAPQEHVASVEERWWDAPGAWHDGEAARSDVDLDRELPSQGAVRMDLDLLASLLTGGDPVASVQLHSRAPGSRLHHIITWLQPDLLAEVSISPAVTGPRPGHDILVAVRSGGGKGRRLLAAAATPGSWTRARGSESVRLQRRFRPCRDPRDTAARLAREVSDALETVGWPLGEWFVLPR